MGPAGIDGTPGEPGDRGEDGQDGRNGARGMCVCYVDPSACTRMINK